MINLSDFMNMFSQSLNQAFGDRVWFVGLQGSHARGEATENSDIDTVVILDALTADDVKTYNAMLDTLPHRELLCGFLSGKEDLLHWEPSDLFQFYYDTQPIKGSLDALLPLLDAASVNRAVKIGACNIFHGCVHNMLYEKSEDILKALYKSASFVLQAICFQENGKYINRQSELKQLLSPDDRIIADTFLHLKKGGAVDFEKMSETLLSWSQKQLHKTT
ncbi:MAG: nucleotidyltransferase domain-containing protein [Clostridia bacterium]|nr:nucleotidyltransferase domain-containing protein [Clostridia bacterium]